MCNIILNHEQGTQAAAAIRLAECKCDVARDYNKKKFVFVLLLQDKSEYLFQANSHEDMAEWIKAINVSVGNPGA